MLSESEADAEPDGVRRALAFDPTELEAKLLASVNDEVLKEKLLATVLRAVLHAPLTLKVCPEMHMSDQFASFNIEDAVKLPYVDAVLVRKREHPLLFTITCAATPANDMTYDGEDTVQDKLIEFFCKDLIRFTEQVHARNS